MEFLQKVQFLLGEVGEGSRCVGGIDAVYVCAGGEEAAFASEHGEDCGGVLVEDAQGGDGGGDEGAAEGV